MTIGELRAADTLSSALRDCAGNVVRTAASAWCFQLRNGKSLAVRATLSEEWLRLTTSARLEPATRKALLNGSRSDYPWRILRLNGQLPPSARVTFERRDRSTSLCVDICLSSEAGIAQRLTVACNRLLEAGALLPGLEEDPPAQSVEGLGTGPWTPSVSANSAPDARLDHDTAAQCRELLNDGQWSWRQRSDDRIRVDLETRRGQSQVSIAQCGDNLRFGMELIDATRLNANCRVALAAFLLSATAQLRLVRAAATLTSERETVGLEVMLGAPLNESDLDTTLRCLATAYDQLGPETLALRHDALAAEYLAVRGWARLKIDESLGRLDLM